LRASPAQKMRTLAGKRKYLRASCAQIAKFANIVKNCAPQGLKFAQKLRLKGDMQRFFTKLMKSSF